MNFHIYKVFDAKLVKFKDSSQKYNSIIKELFFDSEICNLLKIEIQYRVTDNLKQYM